MRITSTFISLTSIGHIILGLDSDLSASYAEKLYEDGGWYQGYWVDGLRHGTGTLTYVSGPLKDVFLYKVINQLSIAPINT